MSKYKFRLIFVFGVIVLFIVIIAWLHLMRWSYYLKFGGKTLITAKIENYELIDSGDGEYYRFKLRYNYAGNEYINFEQIFKNDYLENNFESLNLYVSNLNPNIFVYSKSVDEIGTNFLVSTFSIIIIILALPKLVQLAMQRARLNYKKVSGNPDK